MASVQQQHLRRLMKQQKAKSGSNVKVDHPLARYNSLGQLSCIVCGVQVKSGLLWTTHVQSKKHKETVAILKEQRTVAKPVPPQTPPTAKRKPPDVESESVPTPKKIKVTEEPDKRNSAGVPADFFDQGIPGIEEDGSGSEEEDSHDAPSTSTAKLPSDTTTGAVSTPGEEEQKTASADSKEGLPEGFFDDPKMDAKVRKVEFKDPMTEEWEKFQKSIQKEDEVSEALLFEGDEEAMEDRELTEVNEQVSCFTRAELLRQKQEELMAKKSEQGGVENDTTRESESDTSTGELDFDELMDWRAKIS